MSFWGPVVGGALGLAGSLFGASQSRRGQESANQTNIDLMERNLGFQREVMQNRVQWMANDYEKAGFNKLLATNMQPGMAPGGMTKVENTRKHAVDAGISSARVASEIATQLSSRKVLNAQADKAKAEAQIATQDARAYTNKKWGPYLSAVNAIMRSGAGGIVGAGVGGASAVTVGKALKAMKSAKRYGKFSGRIRG